jgi:peptide/nickel transport system substrate-binding protein
MWQEAPHNEGKMKLRTFALALALAVASTLPASAVTFKFAFQGELKSLDPYSLNESFTLGMLGNVYEGLTKRDNDLKIIPGLAERWEMVEPTRWRFHLRKGVKFHNGEDFTADDVVFSTERSYNAASDIKTRVQPAGTKAVKVDDHTVDFILPSPNPILHYEWDTWYIMSKKWAEANNSVAVQPATGQQMSYAALNTNGTGPYILTSHQAGVRTTYKKNPSYWGKIESNIDEAIFTTISNDATRVAALLSGDVDWIDPVPLQDIPRINASGVAEVQQGPELRTIFLGFDQMRPELKSSNVKGKNPFKDVRVRKAFYLAIDENAIADRVMRKAAVPSALMISPLLFDLAKDFKRPAPNPDEARKLLAEAGYPNGFEVEMDCPNDRYVNDEAICQAVTAMLARVNVKINLNAQPKSKYFAKVLQSGGYDTSFFLLGWTPGSFDSWNVLANMYRCRDEKGVGGNMNLGGYCNPKVEELTNKILVESDKAKRDQMIKEAYQIGQEQDYGFVPLHQQALAWGVSKKVKLKQRADNQILFYGYRKD